MSQRDTIGIIVLVALFAAIAVGMYLSADPRSESVNSFDQSPIVQQRIINLEKSRNR